MVGDVLGTERFEGMLGFDLVTYRGDALPVDADMSINVVLRAESRRERATGSTSPRACRATNKDDILRGTDRIADDMVGHELNAAAIDRIRGLSDAPPCGRHSSPVATSSWAAPAAT